MQSFPNRNNYSIKNEGGRMEGDETVIIIRDCAVGRKSENKD